MSTFEVGQEVTFRPHVRQERGSIPATITKIGRKYVYADIYGWSTPFNKDDGKAASRYSGRLVTPDILAAEQARDAANERVHPLRIGWPRWDRLSTDQLNRIADIIEEQQ